MDSLVEMNGISREQVVSYVIEAVRAEIKGGPVVIQEDTTLQDLNGFDSLFIAGLLERIEDHFGVEMNPALILPETFETPLTIAEALVNSKK